LITVVGVAIIWTAVVPMIRDKIAFEDLTADLTIVGMGGYTVYDPVNDIALVQISQGVSGDEITGAEIIFTIDGNSYKTIVDSPGPNQAEVYPFNFTGLGAPDSVSVAPIFSVGGIERTGMITSTFDIKPGNIADLPDPSSLLAVGLDSRISPPRTCDNVTSCSDNDNCCFAGCDAGSDNDCAETCFDGILNQNENQADCGGICTSGTETNCFDGLDNDNDCVFDCADLDCSAEVLCQGIQIGSCGLDLNVSGETYFLTQNVSITSAKCFNVLGDGITLDCLGHSITGSTNFQGVSYVYGVEIYFRSGVVVKNCVFDTWKRGVQSFKSNDTQVLNSTFLLKVYDAIGAHLQESDGGLVSKNNFIFIHPGSQSSYVRGASLFYTDNVVVDDNEFTFVNYSLLNFYAKGVDSWDGGGHMISNNVFSNLSYGVENKYGQNITIQNNYFYNSSYRAISSQGLISPVIYVEGTVIKNNVILDSAGRGMYFWIQRESNITNNHVCNSGDNDIFCSAGLWLDSTNNTCDDVSGCGFSCNSTCS